MKEVKMRLQRESGATGVIEMTFVFPMTMFVVISLIYLTFSMFLYVHLQGVAETAADAIEITLYDELYDENYIPYFDGFKLSEEGKEKIFKEYSSKLRNLCVLPGMNVDFSFDVVTEMIAPTIFVEMECKLIKGELFTASVERKVYFPEDFANDFELILDVSEDSGALVYVKERIEEVKEAYEEFF